MFPRFSRSYRCRGSGTQNTAPKDTPGSTRKHPCRPHPWEAQLTLQHWLSKITARAVPVRHPCAEQSVQDLRKLIFGLVHESAHESALPPDDDGAVLTTCNSLYLGHIHQVECQIMRIGSDVCWWSILPGDVSSLTDITLDL